MPFSGKKCQRILDTDKKNSSMKHYTIRYFFEGVVGGTERYIGRPYSTLRALKLKNQRFREVK